MARTPTVLGLILCEKVIVEETTRNVTLVNCFKDRQAASFPTEPIPFVLFALLTNGQGRTTLQVNVDRMEDFERIYQRDVTGRFSDPTYVTRCILRVGDCSFPNPGTYQIVLQSGDDILAQRLLTIREEEIPT